MAVQVQPHLFMFFCSLSFIQTLYYPPVQLPKWKILIICLLLISVDVGMEVGFVLWLRPLYSKGKHWPDLIFGIIASVLLALGLIPPYFELFKRQGEVVGINFIFLSIDSLGAYLSIVSVILGNMDTMGIILYAIVAALELGIFVSHFIWCCRFKWFGNAANKMDCDMESDNSNISTNSGKLVNDNDTCEEIIEDHALHGANFGPTEFEKNENESFNKKKKQFNITDIELSTI
ncbi:uncharacterized protein SCODWIG_01570 [Saccharomycodes ludwigii]|uniref:Uncharacterized protein n=2 Tax=Saccharomycodes ludwigii TaxID=36035 RepID=A0A376B5E6_9ASCO|nr:uncharacterized protein SCODWIG_01570 [Saccharomycodes ludwigii]